MSKKDYNDEITEWEDFVEENSDCPAAIFKMAITPWQRAVALEFHKNEKDRELIKERQKTHGKILWAIFTALMVAIAINVGLDPLLKLLGVG